MKIHPFRFDALFSLPGTVLLACLFSWIVSIPVVSLAQPAPIDDQAMLYSATPDYYVEDQEQRSSVRATTLPVLTTDEPERRIQPSRANNWASFAAISSRADQMSAIREAYGVRDNPITYTLGAGVDFEYNDNIFQTSIAKESDFVIRPQARFAAFWNITDLNTLSFDLVGGYGFYANNSQLNDAFLTTGFTPGSRVNLQIFAGDFVITVFDEFNFSNDPLRIVTNDNQIVEDSDYGRIVNNLGIEALWDLNALVLTAGYSHLNYWALGDALESQERTTDLISLAARLNVSPATALGLEGTLSWTDYSQNFQNDNNGYSIGPFITWQPTERTRLKLIGGYQVLDYDSGGENLDNEDLSTWYAALNVAQQLSEAFSHSIEVGRESDLGDNTNYTTTTYIRHTGNWEFIRGWIARTNLGYEWLDDSSGAFEADGNQFRAGVGLVRQIGNGLSLVLRYDYTDLDLDDPLQSYKRNLINASLYYNF